MRRSGPQPSDSSQFLQDAIAQPLGEQGHEVRQLNFQEIEDDEQRQLQRTKVSVFVLLC
jgi:xanthine dehydrogenase molybdopterin-binding subunit B